MKKATAIVFVGLIVLTSRVFARDVERPTRVTADTPLPDRYPYVVKDILKYCRPQKGLWIDLGAGKGQVAIPLIEATSNPVVMLDPDVEAMSKEVELAGKEGLEDRLFAAPRHFGVGRKMPLRFTKDDTK